MSSTTLEAGGPLQQIPAGFVQNLSASANVIVAYSPNPLERDAVIGPGGTYQSSRPAWLSTDGASCPVVWNTDPAASASTPTNVQATVPGAVQISGGTIEANITNDITVGNISGGTVDIGTGTVNSFGKNAWLNLFSGNFSIPAGNVFVSLLSNVDVSVEQSIAVRWNSGIGNYDAIAGITFVWSDETGNQLLVEETMGWADGFTEWITSVKGPRLTVNLFVDYTIYGSGNAYSGDAHVNVSSIKLDEYYYTEPAGGSTGYPMVNTFATFTAPSQAAYTGGIQDAGVYDNTGTQKSLRYILPSFNRLLNGTITYNGLNPSGSTLCGIGLFVAVKGRARANWPALYYKLITGQTSQAQYQYFTAIAPRAPIMLSADGAYTNTAITLAYERF